MQDRFMTSGWRVHAGLLFLSLIVAGLVGEILLRVTGFEGRFSSDWLTPYPRFYFRPDERNGFDISQNYAASDFPLMEYRRAFNTIFQIWSNELGCFDYPYESQERFVYLVGDSFTWGYVPFENAWGTVLERETGTRILKCGVGGYGTRQERVKIETLLPKVGVPNLIIIGYFVGNDLTDDYLFPNYSVIEGHWATKVELDPTTGKRKLFTEQEIESNYKRFLQKRNWLAGRLKRILLQHSEIYNLVTQVPILQKLAYQLGMAAAPPNSHAAPVIFQSSEKYPWLNEAWEEHFRNLRDIQELGKRLLTRVLFVVIPTREQVHELLRPADQDARWDAPNRKLKDFFEREKIEFYDLLQDFRTYAKQDLRQDLDAKDNLYWPYNGHWNLKGNRLAGLLLSQYLLEHHFIGAEDKTKRLMEIQTQLAELALDRRG